MTIEQWIEKYYSPYKSAYGGSKASGVGGAGGGTGAPFRPFPKVTRIEHLPAFFHMARRSTK